MRLRMPIRVPSGRKTAPDQPRSQLQKLIFEYSPILSSLLIHALILLLALTTYTVGKQVVSRREEQEIIPDAMIIEGAEVGAIPNPVMVSDPTRNPQREDAPETSAQTLKRPSQALQAAIMKGSDVDSESALGVGARTGTMTFGAASSSELATPFGASGASAAAPKTMFLGVSGNAKKIVYVCDASGSMVGLKFEALKRELEKSVKDLVPIQAFNVIFFNEERAIMLTKDLLPANSNNKTQLLSFLTAAEPRRGSDPIPSLRYAMLQKPDLVYLLTDGDFLRDGQPINEQVVRELRFLNRDRHVKINTIAFPSGGDGQDDYLRTLKQIAEDSGGLFRAVSTSDLNQAAR